MDATDIVCVYNTHDLFCNDFLGSDQQPWRIEQGLNEVGVLPSEEKIPYIFNKPGFNPKLC